MLELCIKYLHRILQVLSMMVLISKGLYAQDTPNGDKELANELIKMANEVMATTRAMDQAKDNYVSAAQLDPENIIANYKAGEFHILTTGKEEASQYFLKVKQLDPEYRFDIDYQIGVSYQFGLDFRNALTHFNLYKKKLIANDGYRGLDMVSLPDVDKRIEECNNAIDFMANPAHVNIKNVGNSINSEYEDFGPVLNEAEDLLVFTSRRRDGNLNANVDQDNKPYEDIFFARKKGDRWDYAKNIGMSINTEYHNSTLAISSDGNTLFIYSSDNNGDIQIAERQGNDTIWSTPTSISPNINSMGFNESSVSISADGNLLFFSSNRPGGQGGIDIFYSTKEDGKWTRARNAGSVINTKYNEDGCFLDYDGKTLYFSSEGHKGMGRYDIFRTVYDSTAQTWSEPENLGYPINTPDDDIYFVSTKDGKRGYYASVREDGEGFTDIYMVTLPDPSNDMSKTEPVKEMVQNPVEEPKDVVMDKQAVKQPVSLIIKVVDGSTGEALGATVSLKKASDNSEVPIETMNTGEYRYTSQSDEAVTYMLSTEMNGYVFENVSIQISASSDKAQTINKTIRMRKAVVNARKILRNIYFDFDKATLKNESANELGLLERMLKENSSLRIELSGHTDRVGSADYNKLLSQNRADAVKKYLTEKGIEGSRITAVGYGEEKPMASNDDEAEGRELNRRVEFKILQ